MSIKDLGLLAFNAAVGSTRGETVLGVGVAAAGTISSALGGWDPTLQVLVYLMVADYISGLLAAGKTGTINSEVMFWGGIRKAVVLGVVALSVQLDGMIGNSAPVIRTLALYFYAGREGISVVENLGTFGVPLPAGIKNILEQLQQKGEGK